MIKVKELMTSQLYTLKPTDSVHKARELMLNKHIRHIPIIDDEKKLVGLLTKHDVLEVSVSVLAEIDKEMRDELESGIPIVEVMNTEIVVADEETNLLDAAKYMLEQKHGCLPVFRGEELIGILTEADFVKLALHLMNRMDEYESAKNFQIQ